MRLAFAVVGILISLGGEANADERTSRPPAKQPSPDLVIRSISPKPEGLIVLVANRGDAHSGVLIVELRLSASDGRLLSSKNKGHASLAPGEEAALSFSSSVPQGGLAVATADPTNLIAEASETNNSLRLTGSASRGTSRAKEKKPPVDLEARAIDLEPRGGHTWVVGTIRNVSSRDFLGTRTAQLIRIAFDSRGVELRKDVISEEVLAGIPAGTEWSLEGRLPPNVAKTHKYVLMLTLAGDGDPSDSVTENDESRKVIDPAGL